MGLAWEEIQKNSIRFSKDWKDASREIAEGQGFVTDLLGTFGVNIHDIDNKEGGFEFPVKRPNLASKLSVDFLWKGKIAIEMKSKGKDLNYAYVQLKNYMQYLPEDDIPDLWVVCDFEKMQVYRLSTNERWHFNISALHRNVNLFYDITGLEAKSPRKELPEVNVLAAEKMAQLHDKLRKNHYTGHALEVYLVRLLFCLFADHTGIFYDDSFYNFIDKSKKDGSDLSFRLEKLFETLNTPHKSRFQNSFISKDLKDFTYVNGKLFADTLPLPDFDSDIRKLLIECTNFNWSNISPAIFGAMFQGVMDKVRRRELGAHYTSEENILKVIKPLFLDALWEEFKNVKTSNKGLEKLHAKISQIRFLDPACGCGNFLIITYREIRKLEMEILKLLYRSQQPLIPDVACKVSLAQFYGIECEDFPCQIAQVGMWLVDHQMNMVLSEQFGIFAKNLPLVKSANIVCKNALQYDWGTLLPKSDSKNQSTCVYIFGNPPFVGAKKLTSAQRKDISHVFNVAVKGEGLLDYVTAWYYKTAQFMKLYDKRKIITKAAFVSTSSISQGEQVATLWKPLIEQYGIHIDFAYRPFKWVNEAKGKAAVYCVIIGFSRLNTKINRIIYDNDRTVTAKHINSYLQDEPDIFVENRSSALCDSPKIGIGNKPVDGGHYLFTEEEKKAFLLKQPQAAKLFRRWYGKEEFMSGINRWCLFLDGCSPGVLENMPEVLKRIEAVRKYRLSRKSKDTQKLALTPTEFHVTKLPKKPYLVIPKYASINFDYIPIAEMEPSELASDLVFVIEDANDFHFGVLSSKIHKIWYNAVCGRMGNSPRYSKGIVYNNFPWPDPTEKDKKKIEKAAEGIRLSRTLFPNSSLASLYNPITMPKVLRKAHQELDNAVHKAYKFSARMEEKEILAKLIEMYQALIAS